MKSPFVRLLIVAGALCLGLAAFARAPAATASSTRVAKIEQIQQLRAQTWRWQSLMRRPRTPAAFTERRARNEAYVDWVRDLWQRRARLAKRQAAKPPHREQWLCIHRYERHPAQGWRTRTGNGYYGGLQMDMNFQRAYGDELLRRKGTANHWTSVEQMWVAERAYVSGRGFYPWPNTARYCGLL